MKGCEKMDREELMRELEDMFRDEPDNNKLNAVLDLADAYAEHEYEKRARKKSFRISMPSWVIFIIRKR